mmetsp:Transcript_84350/g.272704  ORF Transcript_84350/g.272704 Transcript_84350/m.272704 type:complete len:230 (+) Transcript_84350:2025-2714(+)
MRSAGITSALFPSMVTGDFERGATQVSRQVDTSVTVRLPPLHDSRTSPLYSMFALPHSPNPVDSAAICSRGVTMPETECTVAIVKCQGSHGLMLQSEPTLLSEPWKQESTTRPVYAPLTSPHNFCTVSPLFKATSVPTLAVSLPTETATPDVPESQPSSTQLVEIDNTPLLQNKLKVPPKPAFSSEHERPYPTEPLCRFARGWIVAIDPPMGTVMPSVVRHFFKQPDVS